MAPEAPSVEAPVEKLIAPLTPLVPASTVFRTILPLDLVVPALHLKLGVVVFLDFHFSS